MEALDAIEGLDDGAYSHFGHQVGQYPDIVGFMQPAYYYSSYVGVAVLFAIVMLLFLVQGKRRGAVVAFVSFAASVALIQAVHVMVPRPHPPNADKWLGAEALNGSYPSAAIFLFMLSLILLGFALWERLPRYWMRGLFVVVAAALVGWVCMSGFFLALHYVTDVIGGLAGAALVGWIASRFIAEPASTA
jgi:membrane-associated phospholipid phosphatase